MLKIFLKYKQEVLKTYDFDKSEITIGRLESNDIHINNSSVSKHHARIVKDQDNYSIEDLKSTNGTYLNKTRIIKSYLKDNDVIIVGKYILVTNIETKDSKGPNHSLEDHIAMLDIERYR